MKVNLIALDLAKSVLQACEVNQVGTLMFDLKVDGYESESKVYPGSSIAQPSAVTGNLGTSRKVKFRAFVPVL